jgi:hypothetical protein
MVQLEGLNELVSNASVTDRSLLAGVHSNKDLVISQIFLLKCWLVFQEVWQKAGFLVQQKQKSVKSDRC